MQKANKYLGYTFDFNSFVNDYSDTVEIKDDSDSLDEYVYRTYIDLFQKKTTDNKPSRAEARIECFGDHHVKNFYLWTCVDEKNATDEEIDLKDAYGVLDKYFDPNDNCIILKELQGRKLCVDYKVKLERSKPWSASAPSFMSDFFGTFRLDDYKDFKFKVFVSEQRTIDRVIYRLKDEPNIDKALGEYTNILRGLIEPLLVEGEEKIEILPKWTCNYWYTYGKGDSSDYFQIDVPVNENEYKLLYNLKLCQVYGDQNKEFKGKKIEDIKELDAFRKRVEEDVESQTRKSQKYTVGYNYGGIE